MKVEPTPQIIFFREAPTKVVGGTIALIHGADPVVVSGGPNQKQVAISNPATANSIYVYDGPGRTIMQEIFPRQSWTLLTSAAVYIASSGTGDFNAYIARTIYTNEIP